MAFRDAKQSLEVRTAGDICIKGFHVHVETDVTILDLSFHRNGAEPHHVDGGPAPSYFSAKTANAADPGEKIS